MAWNVKWISWLLVCVGFLPLLTLGQESTTPNLQKTDSTWWNAQKNEVEYFSERPERKKPKTRSSYSPGFDWSKVSFLKYFVLLLIIATLVYVLYRLYGQSVFEFSSKSTGKKLLQLNEEDLEDRFLELDLNKLLKQALSQQNWKMAIRIHFLQILKQLVDSGNINWHSDLTNRQISYQLPTQIRKGFNGLVAIYEMAWYSNAKVNSEFYDRVKPKFDRYQTEITHE